MINEDLGEIMYAYESTKGLVQGRITYFKNMMGELTFNLSGRTVSHFGDVRDIGTMLTALGTDLVMESKKHGDEVERVGDDSPSMSSEPEDEEHPNGPDLRHTYVKP
jgi:hypothetical protein